ncbi:MAG: twin-arginine translocase subunit TatC [Cyclobacteriaceae bacterium]|jgi:sec-independent protein translocase protein TatC|nr:twin-arginine translocase subunit TatC [Flammeovirgaceae bacterium]
MPLDQPQEEAEMSFLDHLEELRWHIVRSLTAIAVGMVVAFIFSKWIFTNIIFAPANPDFPTFQALCRLGELVGNPALCVQEIPFKVQSRYMTGQFTMQIMASFVIGFIIAFPYVVWELWRFIKPGLHSHERNNSRGAVSAISLLFFMGSAFGYFVLCPLMTWFFASYSISDMISNEFDITSYVSTFVALVFGSGLLFQLPVVVYFLTRIGLLTPQFMRTYRKHAIIVILIIGAIVTPPDPLSQVLISLPLVILYEISIFISAYVVRQNRKREEEELKAERL